MGLPNFSILVKYKRCPLHLGHDVRFSIRCTAVRTFLHILILASGSRHSISLLLPFFFFLYFLLDCSYFLPGLLAGLVVAFLTFRAALVDRGFVSVGNFASAMFTFTFFMTIYFCKLLTTSPQLWPQLIVKFRKPSTKSLILTFLWGVHFAVCRCSWAKHMEKGEEWIWHSEVDTAPAYRGWSSQKRYKNCANCATCDLFNCCISVQSLNILVMFDVASLCIAKASQDNRVAALMSQSIHICTKVFSKSCCQSVISTNPQVLLTLI